MIAETSRSSLSLELPPGFVTGHGFQRRPVGDRKAGNAIERIIYAGQAASSVLRTVSRAGISIGDGTGTGKTATLAGVILDNWFQRRRWSVGLL
ncbi:MAG: strawberry notch family protein [Chloracidobacterium sp.]|nr:strawberry notch family protein [Chloracidobacterium sp.]